MDILIIVFLMVQIILLVVGISSFRYLTDEIKRQADEIKHLISEKIRRLEQKSDDQAMVLNELKGVCKGNKSNDNNVIALKILDVLTKMQFAPVSKPEPETPKREIPEPKIPKRELKTRSQSAEMSNVFDKLGI